MFALASTAAIDQSLVTEIVNLVKTVIGLYAEFPLNVMLIGSLFFLGIGIFRGARSAV